jgi:protein-S-isoprenylcysteine O-methyltransferase Ste14
VSALPTLPAAPWPHLAFAALHLLAGQGLSSFLYRRRFGGSPLVLYRPGPPTRHRRLTRAIAAASLGWTATFLAYALWPWFRTTFAGRALVPAPMLAGWLLGTLGLALMLAAQVDLGASFRVGQDEGAAPPPLVTTGLHARSRHPVYLGSLLYLAALTSWAPCALTLAALLVIGVLLHALALTEESHLARVHGPAWQQYAGRTRRYL